MEHTYFFNFLFLPASTPIYTKNTKGIFQLSTLEEYVFFLRIEITFIQGFSLSEWMEKKE